MSEFTMDRLRENLEALKMKNTLEILDNYLERAVADKLNIVEVLDHIFSEEAKSKRRRAYEKQIQMSGFPIKKTLDDFDFSFQPSIDKRQIDELATMRFLENGENVVFLGPPGVGKTHLASALGLVAAQHRFSTYYINCHQLIEQLKKAHFENRLPDKLKVLAKYRMLIIDEIGYLPMDIQGANLFFQLIARRYEKTSTVFTSNKTFSQWNEVFADVTIASAILDRVLHHCTVINIKGESYRLKERKEFMRQKQQIVNTLLSKETLSFVTPPPKNYKISSAFSYNFKLALTESSEGRTAEIMPQTDKMPKQEQITHKEPTDDLSTQQRTLQPKTQTAEPETPQIPPKPVMSAEAAAYPKLLKIYKELNRQNGIIFDAERMRNELELERDSLKGLAKLTKKGELQSRIDRKNEEIDLLKVGLSGIVKRYGFQTVHDFYKVFSVSKTANAEYRNKVDKWEEQYGEKVQNKEESISKRLRNYQRENADRQTKQISKAETEGQDDMPL